jgi:hypothetical protein
MRLSIAAIVLALLSLPAYAGKPTMTHIEIPAGEAVAEASADCALGLVYDDGGFVDFYGSNPAFMVMRFDLPAGSNAIDQVCSCFARDTAGSSNLPFDVVVFDDNGAGGSPGTFLGSVAASATSIPVAGNYDFYNVSLAGSGIVLPDSSVYVGVHYNSASHFVCGDRSAETPVRAVYNSGDGSSWVNSTTSFSGSGPNAWGIRVDPATTGTTCTPTLEALCLNNGRFRVTASFETTAFSSGNARAVKLTDETGYFWFFESSNVEVVVKVLDGCGYNNRYWLFAGGLTNVRTVLTVTDTSTGMMKTYVNPQETPFEPIQDTSAFATCP